MVIMVIQMLFILMNKLQSFILGLVLGFEFTVIFYVNTIIPDLKSDIQKNTIENVFNCFSKNPELFARWFALYEATGEVVVLTTDQLTKPVYEDN